MSDTAKKITELDEASSMAGTDLLAIVADAATTPVTKKIQKANLYKGNEDLFRKAIILQLVADATDVDTTSGVMANLPIPQVLNGYNLIRATAIVSTAGETGATTIQVRNLTKYPSNDALSSAISIASGDTVATAGTVNTSYDDVATDDKLKIYVTAQSTTKPKGLYVVLEFQKP